MRFSFKLFSKKRTKEEDEIFHFIVLRFGYRPSDTEVFRKALTHKSISNNSEEDHSNERLEYLGDAILDAVVADFLFTRFPEEP